MKLPNDVRARHTPLSAALTIAIRKSGCLESETSCFAGARPLCEVFRLYRILAKPPQFTNPQNNKSLDEIDLDGLPYRKVSSCHFVLAYLAVIKQGVDTNFPLFFILLLVAQSLRRITPFWSCSFEGHWSSASPFLSISKFVSAIFFWASRCSACFVLLSDWTVLAAPLPWAPVVAAELAAFVDWKLEDTD